MLPPSSPSLVLAQGANNLPDVLGPGCLLPSPSLLPLPFCSVFVHDGDIWCVAFVDLTILPLSVGVDFEGFHPNSPPSFLVLCSSLISFTHYAAHRLLLDLPRAPCDVLQRPCSNGFSASWQSALPPSVHWFRAYLASPLCRASFVPY